MDGDNKRRDGEGGVVGEDVSGGGVALHPSSWSRPYRNLWHPEKTVLDRVVSMVIPRLLPLDAVATAHPDPMSSGARAAFGKVRESMRKMEKPTSAEGWKAWDRKARGKGLRCGVTTGTILAPRIDVDVLARVWGIPNLPHLRRENDATTKTTSSVRIELLCPSSALRRRNEKDGDDDDDGKIRCLEDVDPSLGGPVLLWFHGGGFVSFSARDGQIERYGRLLAEEDDGATLRPLTVLSVEYRLSPEHPFPCALIDGLSAVSHVLAWLSPEENDDKTTTRHTLHVGGMSAGGNLAAVTSLEYHRRHPGKIRSVVIIDPTFSPLCDSASCRIESLSSGCCPVIWLRWSWRAYLGLDASDHAVVVAENDKEDAVRRRKLHLITNAGAVSRHPFWSRVLVEERWKKVMRLVRPASDLPNDLNENDAPSFLVKTSTADPLLDDGTDFVRALTDAGARVEHVSFRGSHVVSFDMDASASKRFLRSWRALLWG